MTHTQSHRTLATAATLLALALPGCGSADKQSASRSSQPAPANSTGTAGAGNQAGPTPTSSPTPAPGLAAAENPSVAEFPPASGKTLQQIGNMTTSQGQLGAATGVFTPGTRRVAFGLNASSGEFIYGPTALYFAPRPGAPAQGPFLAPADPLGVAPRYRSQQNAAPGGIQGIYAASLPLPRAGTYAILALTSAGGRLVGSPGEIAVAATSPIPGVGQRAPAIATDTPASVAHPALLTTRVPPDDMHAVSFKEVLGRRPVVLLFSTPQFCVSRVCGPVTDIAVELEHQFGHRAAFIHEEVYVNNDPKRGLRPQLKAFHLQTEPWVFTVDRRGRIAARLEGAFGVKALSAAITAALS